MSYVDIGINLWGEGISFNTIMGNLIGTDPTGSTDWGNNGTGIEIGDGASHNIIGPNNVIAYNGQYGINMGRESIDFNWSIGNTITGNSIHSNGHGGINLWGDSNNRSEPPTILDFNLATGTVTGATYANCTIEIFSDGSLQGEVYEGKTKADANGIFTFNKGTSFIGPYLTATATDVEGNTSQFSAPTFGESKSIVLQEGNSSPKLQIRPRISSELVDNRLGHLGGLDVHSDSSVEDWIYKMTTDMSYTWTRTGLAGNDFNWPNWGITREEISPYQDKAITDLAENGIEVILILEYGDAKMAGEPYWCYKEEDQIQGFLDQAQFIVHHFKDRVEYYEISSEPELVDFGKPFIEVADYINLVRRVVPVIRQEYPEAKIVIPCTGSLYQNDVREYFFEVIESDVMPLVDVITWHIGPASPEYKAKDYYSYPDLVQEIKDTASEHGFRGEYFIEELMWRTPKEPHPVTYDEYGEISSAKYYGRGIVMNLGMDFTYIGGGPEFEYYDEVPYATRVVRNLGTIMAGAEPIDMSVEMETQSKSESFFFSCQRNAEYIRQYSFSLPNGDKLVTLWIDGKAVDGYPGIETTVTIPGFSTQRVVGIDVLNGFEQELIMSREEGNLVIENLLIKDYPIILRLSP
jgi:parallel beta-helix repeat protein